MKKSYKANVLIYNICNWKYRHLNYLKPFPYSKHMEILRYRGICTKTVETSETFRILLFKTSDKITIQKSYILFKRFLRTFHPFPDLNVFSYSTFNTGFPLLYFSIDWNIEQSKMHVVYLSFHKRNCKTFFKNLWPIRSVLMYTKLHINGSHLK